MGQDYVSAIADFDKVLALSPTDAQAYGYRGLGRLALRRDEEAEQDFTKCFQLSPSLRPRIEGLANQIRQQRKPK